MVIRNRSAVNFHFAVTPSLFLRKSSALALRGIKVKPLNDCDGCSRIQVQPAVQGIMPARPVFNHDAVFRYDRLEVHGIRVINYLF